MKINIKKNIGNLDISFETNSQSIGVVGDSGAGKSMLLKCIAGLETPDFGEIIINDKILFSHEKNVNLTPQERKIGYLFQNYTLFDNLSVYDNIKIVNNKIDFEKIIDICKIYDILDKYPNQISGGQKQRVAIARILASNVDIILLDEPFSALDNILKSDLEFDLRIALKNKKFIHVSHDISEVFRMVDEILIIDNGEKLLLSNKNDILNNITNAKSAKILGYTNFVKQNNIVLAFDKHSAIITENGIFNGKVIDVIKDMVGYSIICMVNHERVEIFSSVNYKINQEIKFNVTKYIEII